MKVAPIASGEGNQRLRATGWARPFKQFDEARPARHQPIVIQLKGTRQDFDFVLAGQIFGSLEGEGMPGLIKFATGIFLELHSERRHNVEGGMEFRDFLQHFNHAPIIFERV